MTEFRNPECAFEDAPRMGRPSTITIDENIEAVEQIVMRNRQVSVRRLAYELGFDHGQSIGHEEGLHTVGTEIVDTNSTYQPCGLLSRAK